MKKLIQFLFAIAISFGAAQAQYNLITTTLNGGTNSVAASTTTSTTAPVLSFTRSTYGAVQATCKLDGAGTTAVVFTFDESIDGSRWVPSTRTLSVTPAGTTQVSAIQNYTIGASGYLRLKSINNPNASNLTNVVLNYSYKPGI